MPRKTSVPPELVRTVLRYEEARACGVNRGRIYSRDIQHPFHGVAAAGLDLDDLRTLCTAYATTMRDVDAFSHVTALQLFDAPLPPMFQAASPLHVISACLVRRTGRGIIGHVSESPFCTVRVRGLPTVAPADAWCQASTILSREDLVAVGDHLVTPRRIGGSRLPPLVSLDELRDAASRYGPRRGAVVLRWAAPRLRVGPGSRPETLLRLLLVAAGLPEPAVQHPIEVGAGLILHSDLPYPQWRRAIEYEGDGHRVDKQKWRDDLARYERMQDAGWRVIRVQADDLFIHPGRLIARIRRLIP